MGVVLSTSLDDDLVSNFETVFVRSVNLVDGNVGISMQSVSPGGKSEHSIMRPYGSRKFIVEGHLIFKKKESDTEASFKMPSSDKENISLSRVDSSSGSSSRSPSAESGNGRNLSETSLLSPSTDLTPHGSQSESWLRTLPDKPTRERNKAAVKLQKVYKSFRTRRQLADCAVLAEQQWWKLLDFAELKQSSISFFDVEKPETAVSRWSRARTKAAKVGKGLSKDEKARKLALQHWLEAIDPRHRYGHNLQFYYVNWLHSESKEPFFYWLDIGEGKEVNLEGCPRSKLQQQCIKYLGPVEREAYEVVFENGKFFYKQSRKVLDTTQGPKDTKWIFVLSTSKMLYAGQKIKGTFQHSSFLAGGATLAAGRLVVSNGTLQAVWPHSGHYLPTEENFKAFMSFLEENNIDLTDVKRSPSEEEEEAFSRCMSSGLGHLAGLESYQDLENIKANTSAQENSNSGAQDISTVDNMTQSSSRLSRVFASKVTKLEIPEKTNAFQIFKEEPQPSFKSCPQDIYDGDYETAEELSISEEEFMFPKANLFCDDIEDEEEDHVPKEKIMQRIDSHKRSKSYQLAQQLSSRWSTGAGPRISCMRDYPSELQFRVLEHAHLSPRPSSDSGAPRNVSNASPRVMTPTVLSRMVSADGTIHHVPEKSDTGFLSTDRMSPPALDTSKHCFRP